MPGLVTGLDFIPLERGRHYRHMAKRDAEVWERFIERQRLQWLGVAYDVALGGVPASGEGDDRTLSAGWQYSTALKVDAVLMDAARLVLVEVRPYAHAGTLGNALCYTLIAQREQISNLPLAPMVVCEAMQRDVKWVAQALGIQVIEV